MSNESLLLLFEAMIALTALAAFFRIDAVTIARLFTHTRTVTRTYSAREVIIAILLAISFIASGLGFLLSKEAVPHLSERQMRALIKNAAAMRAMFKYMPVGTTNGEPETEPLAHEIASAFNRAGIEPMYVFTRPDNPDQNGVIICLRDLNNPPSGTDELQSALRSAGLDFKVRGFPARGFNNLSGEQQLVIWVAPPPL